MDVFLGATVYLGVTVTNPFSTSRHTLLNAILTP